MKTIKDELIIESISNWIFKGVTNGYYPHWEISILGLEKTQLTFPAFNHISKSILKGYTEGEIVEEREHKDTLTGWWKLKIQNE